MTRKPRPRPSADEIEPHARPREDSGHAQTVMLDHIDPEGVDSRANPESTNLREITSLYYQSLKRAVHAADPNPRKPRAKELMRLVSQEREAFARMRQEGRSRAERRQQLHDSANRRRINALHVDLGTAELLEQGDWIVNRNQDITEGMGTVSYAEMESLILQFHHQNDLLATTDPISEGKLIHLDLGCGNGIICETLRQDETEPFDNGRVLMNYWGNIGYADRLYYTLGDLLYELVAEEHKDNPALIEFISVVATLITRRMYFDKRYSSEGKRSRERETLIKLAKNPNLLRTVMLDLGRYIKNLKSVKEITGDKEFMLDESVRLSDDCLALIREYFDGRTSSRSVRRTKKDFLQKYFKSELHGDSHAIERKIQDKEEEVMQATIEIGGYDRQLKEIGGRLKAANEEEQQAKIKQEQASAIAARKVIFERRKELIGEKKKLEERRVDLAEHITVYPHNVVIGAFERFAEVFPKSPTFDFVTARRSTSHSENADYIALYWEVAQRMKPGGVFLEEGFRESYTRDERLQELAVLQQQLGPEYKIGVIANDEGGQSVIIERAVNVKNKRIFFTDQFGERILRSEKDFYVPIDDFARHFPQAAFRTEIIRRLKILFIDTALEGTAPEERYERVLQGRMAFRGLHAAVNAYLDEKVFKSPYWINDGQHKGPGSDEMRRLHDRVYVNITATISRVKMRAGAVLKGAMPLRNSSVSTYPSATELVPEGYERINRTRSFKVPWLPRNSNVPTLGSIELAREIEALVTALDQIIEITNKPPFRLLEFDTCFTNPLMRDTIQSIFGFKSVQEMERYFKVENVKLGSGQFPAIEEGEIVIIGGSLNDPFDPLGEKFINEFGLNLLKSIQDGAAIRADGVCFGSQSLLEAYGILTGQKGIRTVRGATEFGLFPVVFKGKDPALKFLRGQHCSVPMTRSGYTIVPNHQGNPDLEAIAFECMGFSDGNYGQIDEGIPPVGFKMLDGKVKVLQFHPDIRSTAASHKKHLRNVLQRPGYGQSVPDSVSALKLFNQNIDIGAIDKRGDRTDWVAADVGPAILLPMWRDQAESLLEQLKAA